MQGNTPRQILENYKEIIINAFVDSLEKNQKVVSGALAQSFNVNIRAFAKNMVIEVTADEYWYYVDQGRKKGGKMPPLNAMLKHIAQRGEWHSSKWKRIMTEYKNKKGQIIKRKKPLPAKTAQKTLAFLIGRSIKVHGIKPTHFVQEALDSGFVQDIQRDISIALGREIVLGFNLE